MPYKPEPKYARLFGPNRQATPAVAARAKPGPSKPARPASADPGDLIMAAVQRRAISADRARHYAELAQAGHSLATLARLEATPGAPAPTNDELGHVLGVIAAMRQPGGAVAARTYSHRLGDDLEYALLFMDNDTANEIAYQRSRWRETVQNSNAPYRLLFGDDQ